jgi:signal transduction histidine kinase
MTTVPMTTDRRRAVPARVRIMCWLLLLMTVVLAAVCLVTRNLLRQQAHDHVSSALQQEAQEFSKVARGGVDERNRPFAGAEDLLVRHLERQFPDDDEILAGWVPRDGGITLSQDRAAFDEAMLDRILAAPVTAGVDGGVHWAKVVAEDSDGGRGVFVIGYLVDRDLAEVDATIRTLVYACLAGLLFAGVAAWVVAGQILTPVRLVRQTAAQITEQDLTRRIPVHGKDDIAALAEQFNAMLDRLEQAFATQRRFLDDASHELRTPITIIRGHLELAEPADLTAVRRICTDELDRMARIVDDLLVLAKAERPDFVRPQPVELAELTSDVDAKVRALGDRDWRLDGIGAGTVHVDQQRVTQAVVALAHNAVQHTGDGDRVLVGSALRDGQVSFWVTDTGPGVPEADRATIFDRFSRGSAPGHRGGAGLGLAIVRAIAEAHHGRVVLLSTPGEGATFGIELPSGEPCTGY